MKVLFIYYSSTGNTEHVAHLIGNELKKESFETEYVSAMNFIKALQLGKKDEKIILNPNEKSASLAELENAFESADIIAIGAYSFCLTSPPGFNEIFSSKVLSSECFKNVKFIFSFATYGWKIGETLNVIATTLHSRCPSAFFLGGLGVRTPENAVSLLPHKPYRDQWDPEEIAKAKNFGENIANRLKTKDFSGISPYQSVSFQSGNSKDWIKHDGLKILNEAACWKCGLCVRVCPYSAISISKDQNNGFPVFDHDSCWNCCCCYNKCPNEAIDFALVFESDKRSRHPLPFIDPVTGLSPATAAGNAKHEKIIGTPLPDETILTQRLAAKK